MSRRHFTHPLTVLARHIDHMGHVNNAVYLQWAQEAVLAHWHAHASPEMVDRFVWIALRHEIEFHRPAFLGEPLFADLLLESVDGLRARYQTKVRRGVETIAEVWSQWCSVDARTHRPRRLGAELIEHFLGSPFRKGIL